LSQKSENSLNKLKKGRPNYKGIIYLLALIMVMGIVILYSSSYILIYKSAEHAADEHFMKQLKFIVMGVAIMLVVAFIPLDRHIRYAPFYMIGTVFLLLAVFAFTSDVHSHRWIQIPGINIQPSELAKVVLIVFLASYFFKRNQNETRGIVEQFIIPFSWVVIVTLLVAAEPDLSTSIIIFSIGMMVMYISGLRLTYIFLIVGLIIIALILAFQLDLIKPYQLARIQNFLGLIQEGEAQGQVDVSLKAISSGGFLGQGLGLGSYKYVIPVQFTDFIFAILGEELGFFGMAVLLILYYFMCRNMVNAAIYGVKHQAAKVIIVGYSYLIMLQVVINVGVVFGLLPPTGVTLPFVSYGGSSMLSFLMGFGFVISALNYSENNEKREVQEKNDKESDYNE
jgi:cell division protein FtsW